MFTEKEKKNMILIQDVNNIQTFLELITSFKIKYMVQEKKSFLTVIYA